MVANELSYCLRIRKFEQKNEKASFIFINFKGKKFKKPV